MKVFIVFLGLLILNVSFITYHGDLNRYVRLQVYLKALAEEAAAGVAMYYDEDAYGSGAMIINRTEGEKYLNSLLKNAEKKLRIEGGSLTAAVEVFDDGDGASAMGISPWVTVTLGLTVPHLFRLTFLNREQVVRSARYELAHYP
jgi:hypothetical protein